MEGFWSNFVDFEFMWVLTRAPLKKGTKKWKAMKAKTNALIRKKVPSYDLKRLRPTLQSSSYEYAVLP